MTRGASDWPIFDTLIEGRRRWRSVGSLTCPAGIMAARLGEVWGDGNEEKITHEHIVSISLALLFIYNVYTI